MTLIRRLDSFATNPMCRQRRRCIAPLDFDPLILWTFAIALCVAQTLNAQSRQIPAPPQNHPVVIHGATIHPVSSAAIDKGYLVFEKGIITAVGQGEPASLPEGAVKVNGDGMHVYPGLISASSYIGLSEVGDVTQTQDHSEMGRVKSEVHAAVAINPDSDHIPVARANGILTALVMPRGGLVAGRCSAVRLDGWTWEDMAISPDAGLVINWPRTEPVVSWWMERNEEQQRREIREELEAIEQVFDDAVAYLNAKDANPTLETDLRYEHMRGAIEGKKPIFISAALAGQIESAIAWSQRRGLKIAIIGGAQADKVAPLLKKHDIPVILTDIHRLPTRRHDAYDAAFSLPARLHAAGVRFCFATGGEPANERNLNHMAGTSVAYGLAAEEALKAITLNSAEIIGLKDRLGSLEIGKQATLIITSGSPLEITTDTLVAYIDGRRIDLGSRHKALYDKYQEKYRQLGFLGQ